MGRTKVFAFAISAVFLLTLASSTRADTVQVPPGLQKFDLGDLATISLPDISRDDIRDLLSEHFSNNNGNHFGFLNSLNSMNSSSATTTQMADLENILFTKTPSMQAHLLPILERRFYS